MTAALLLSVQSLTACQSDISDAEISEAVRREFIHDPVVLASNIPVETAEGIVTLEGSTENLQARDRAERIAETVRGVRAVINRIQVDPPEAKTDDAIQEKVEEAFYRDPAVDSYEVTAAVQDGSVTLTGTVESWTERELSETVAMGVSGVIEVDNRIEVDSAEARDDLEIEREIEEALRWDVLVDHALIEVTVTGGTVFLQGVVGSAAEKRRTRRIALVPGVKNVNDSRLLVQRWARDEELREGKYGDISDEQIEDALGHAIRRDPRLSGTDVSITSSDGTVTLGGSVENLKAWRNATDLAHNTVGVNQVVNRLVVQPSDPPNDAEVAQHVKAALENHVLVDPQEIEVSVVGGMVTLSGSVESAVQRAHADDVAATVRGVVDVENALEISNESPPLVYDPFVWGFDPRGLTEPRAEPYPAESPDEVIREAVKQELFWSPFVDETSIVVSVEGGVVTLSGTVTSLREKARAIENAYQGGAGWVEEELTVVPPSGSP